MGVFSEDMILLTSMIRNVLKKNLKCPEIHAKIEQTVNSIWDTPEPPEDLYVLSIDHSISIRMKLYIEDKSAQTSSKSAVWKKILGQDLRRK